MSDPTPVLTATPWPDMVNAARQARAIDIVASLHFLGHDVERDGVSLRDFGSCAIDGRRVESDRGITKESLTIRPLDDQGRYGAESYTLVRAVRLDDRPTFTREDVHDLEAAASALLAVSRGADDDDRAKRVARLARKLAAILPHV